jgi:hypothetical protein
MLPKFPVTSASGFSASFCSSDQLGKYSQQQKIFMHFRHNERMDTKDSGTPKIERSKCYQGAGKYR